MTKIPKFNINDVVRIIDTKPFTINKIVDYDNKILYGFSENETILCDEDHIQLVPKVMSNKKIGDEEISEVVLTQARKNIKSEERTFSGNTVCINSNLDYFTKGNTYRFIDGFCVDDYGNRYPLHAGPIESANELDGVNISFAEINELYNGTVTCIESNNPDFVEGCLYMFKDGYIQNRHGNKNLITKSPIEYFEDLNDAFNAKFLEIQL